MEIMLTLSLGIKVHDNIAPETGTKNFQKLSSLTTIPGRLSNFVQIETPAALTKLNQANAS